MKAAAPEPTWAKAGAAASYGSASQPAITSLAKRVKAAAPEPTWAKAGASYGSASLPAIIIGKDSRKADAVLSPDENIENNPMQSSMVVAGMDALSDPAKTF